MADKKPIRELDRLDGVLAAVCGTGAAAVYIRTMAPDILYGDSAELQTLAYTLGHTHSTGYPVYLFLARLVGFLPLNAPAWRVTFFSVLMASLSVAGVYILGRLLTSSRAGAFLAAVWLALSYTLWSQAIITEVYTPGAAFLTWILVLVLYWYQAPQKRSRALFGAALLAGLSPGVHATTVLAALPAAVFVLIWLVASRASRAQWKQTLLAGAGGAVLGMAIWAAAFFYIDWHNPSSSFINVTMYPSRSFWKLTPEDFDSPIKRIGMVVDSVQWKGTLFAGGSDAVNQSFTDYFTGITVREFSVWFLILGLFGVGVLFSRSLWRGGYLLVSYGLVVYYVFNYRPDDQYVFFLSTYIPFTAAAAVGMGALIEAPARWKILARHGWGTAGAVVVTLLLAWLLTQSSIPERTAYLETGTAGFVEETYQYPVENLREPRLLAQMHLTALPDNALVLMEWRDLYAVSYLANVEGKKPGLTLVEAMPSGNNGRVADSMIEIIRQALAEGRPVFAANRYPGLERHFRLAAAANHYVQIMEKER